MNKKVLINAQNITKIYNVETKNPFQALNDVSLQVKEGEFLCIMGASGSGKSTLINNISTIDIPTKGRVYIDGTEVNIMSEKQMGQFRYEKIGFIFQNYNLLEALTIYENIAAPLSLQGYKSQTIKTRVYQMAKTLKIEETLDKFPSECSGGQKQRAAICRALVTQPKVIIADEPTGNLDSQTSHELLSLLKQLNEKQHIAIIMVTHDAQIASYSSKVIYIQDGRIHRELLREGKSQRDYFFDIIKMTSHESLTLFDNEK